MEYLIDKVEQKRTESQPPKPYRSTCTPYLRSLGLGCVLSATIAKESEAFALGMGY